MQISPVQRGVFEHQANRIEKVLSSLALPTRVQGGQVSRDRIRYHLAPVSNAQVHQVRAMSARVAEAMGVYKVHIDQDEEGLVLDLALEEESQLRLIPLIMDLAHPLPMTSVVGISMHGKPLLLNIRRIETWHLGIFAPIKSGKSELLRTMIISLALYNRQSQLQFFGIDFSGKELTVIDALPHAHAQVAIERGYAEEIIQWLVEEIEERKVNRVMYPDIVLAIDELDRVISQSELILGKLPLILHEGPKTGVHLMIASRNARPGSLMSNWRKSGVVTVWPVGDRDRMGDGNVARGQFEFRIEGKKILTQVAWLPAKDLQQAITMVQTGWRANKGLVDLKALW